MLFLAKLTVKIKVKEKFLICIFVSKFYQHVCEILKLVKDYKK